VRGAVLIVGICASAAGCTLLVDANGLSTSADGPANDGGTGDSRVDGGSTKNDAAGSPDGSTGSAIGPVSMGRSPGARISCAGGKFDCNPPDKACCLIMGNQIDFCVDTATAAADCKSSMGFSTVVIACSDEGDCPAGNVCCIGLGDSKEPVTASVCATSCPADQYAMCRMGGGACPSGKSCERIDALEALGSYGYRVCK
jgi:hypothetical protein